MRKPYIDRLRTLTGILVVFYHVIWMYNGILSAGVAGPLRETQPQDVLQYLLYPWFMVLLFLLAGMSARYALERRSPRDFFRERTRRLLLPSTLGLLVFQWVQGWVNMSLSDAFATIPADMPKPLLWLIMALSGTGVLWFLQLLWLLSAALLLLRRAEGGRLAALCDRLPCHPGFQAALALPVWAAAQILNAPVIVVYRFGIYGCVFLLGYYYFSQERVTDALTKYWPLFAVAAAILGPASAYLYFGRDYASPPVVNSPLSIAYGWSACLALLGLMKRFGNQEPGRLTRFLNGQSWGLYLLHYLPLSLCGLLFRGRTDLPPLAVYLLSALAAYGGAPLLYALLSRLPFLRWCVLGLPRKREKAGKS